MDVDQGAEAVARLVQELQATSQFVIALEGILPDDVGAAAGGQARVIHPVAAMLVEAGEAERPVLADRAADGALEIRRVVVAVAGLEVATRLARGAHRVELHHAGRRVAAEQRALRAAEDLDHLQVERRKALQDRVLLHHVVVDQRDGLRRIEVEVRVAEATHVEAREGAAEGRLDQQARHAARQEAHVVAARGEDVQLLVAERRHRHRDVLHVFDPALGRDHHRIERSALREGCRHRQRHGDGRGEATPGRYQPSALVSVKHRKTPLCAGADRAIRARVLRGV